MRTTTRCRLQLGALLAVASLLQACSAVPISTMLRFAGASVEDLVRSDPEGLRVRISVPEGFEVDASKAVLTLKIDRPDGSSRDLAMRLDLLERSRMPRSTGLFRADRLMPTQTLRLSPESVESLASIRQDLARRPRGGGLTFGVRFGFSKVPAGARSAQFWVDLKLAEEQGWFTLFENATLQFGAGPTGG